MKYKKIFNYNKKKILSYSKYSKFYLSPTNFPQLLVKLKMQGSCSGCPSSQITLKSGIEGLLKRMVPEVMEVEAEAD